MAVASCVLAADHPQGFFVADLRAKPAVPAFYNLETQRLEPFTFRQRYSQFIDVEWDRERGRVFFSAKRAPGEPFRIFVKTWPEGEEKAIYENPLGPFRFLLSPDGKRAALQIMGPSAWPTIGVLELETGALFAFGPGYSPDWSRDSQRLLFLRIPGSLPTYLMEYSVEKGTATQIRPEPVMEAVYTDDSEQIVLKIASQAKKCDMFQMWNRRNDTLGYYCPPNFWKPKKACPTTREIAVFPGHQAFYFKESESVTDNARQSLVVCDAWGGRLQTLPHEDWAPSVRAVTEMHLLVGEEPLAVLPVDGAGGRTEIPQAGFLRAIR